MGGAEGKETQLFLEIIRCIAVEYVLKNGHRKNFDLAHGRKIPLRARSFVIKALLPMGTTSARGYHRGGRQIVALSRWCSVAILVSSAFPVRKSSPGVKVHSTFGGKDSKRERGGR